MIMDRLKNTNKKTESTTIGSEIAKPVLKEKFNAKEYRKQQTFPTW